MFPFKVVCYTLLLFSANLSFISWKKKSHSETKSWMENKTRRNYKSVFTRPAAASAMHIPFEISTPNVRAKLNLYSEQWFYLRCRIRLRKTVLSETFIALCIHADQAVAPDRLVLGVFLSRPDRKYTTLVSLHSARESVNKTSFNFFAHTRAEWLCTSEFVVRDRLWV